MRFLRTRLFAATFGVTTLILLGAGIFLYLSVRASVISEFDESLLARAQSLSSLVEQEGDQFEVEFQAEQMPNFADTDRPEYFQIRSFDGKLVAKSPSLGERCLDPSRSDERPSYRFVELSEAGTVRMLTVALPIRSDHRDVQRQVNGPSDERATQGASQVTVCVARDTRDVERSLSTIGWLLVFVLLGASLVSAGTMMAVVRRGLKPLNALAERISHIDDRDLSKRIDLPDSVGELGPVVSRLNEMLARLDQAVRREKAFTANVAHELRTPLAGLETALEVCASRPRQAADYRQVVSRCLDATQAMRGMVNNLLLLARADAGQLSLEKEPVEIETFVSECWIPFEDRASERGLSVDLDTDLDATNLTTDREKLRIVLHNLFDNAVRHSESGGQVSASCVRAGDDLVFEIKNTANKIEPSDADKLFDRFWRKDEPRTEGARHCGLGLSLSRQIVELLGGTITASASPGATFVVRMLLPIGG